MEIWSFTKFSLFVEKKGIMVGRNELWLVQCLRVKIQMLTPPLPPLPPCPRGRVSAVLTGSDRAWRTAAYSAKSSVWPILARSTAKERGQRSVVSLSVAHCRSHNCILVTFHSWNFLINEYMYIVQYWCCESGNLTMNKIYCSHAESHLWDN